MLKSLDKKCLNCPHNSLYYYIHRNIKDGFNSEVILPIKTLIPRMRKVVHTCPSIVQQDIFQDLEAMGFIKLVHKDKCIILNKKNKKRLNDYAFPIHP